MRRLIWAAAGSILVVLSVLMAVASKELISQIIIGLMGMILALAVWIGMRPLGRYTTAFRTATRNIRHSTNSTGEMPWSAVCKMEHFFQHGELDRLFREYVEEVEQQRRRGIGLNDVSKIVNEDLLFVHSWQGVMQQIPGTLTGLGILGTFVGLVIGISGIRFDDASTAINSIQELLGGMGTAFYTSIAGVILSILYNIINRMQWNIAVREMSLFQEEFYRYIIPSGEEQSRIRSKKEFGMILDKLEHMPDREDFRRLQINSGGNVDAAYETEMLIQIQEGLKRGEFTFCLQPIFDLSTKRIIGAESLARWYHPTMGIVKPGVFMPVIEKNGYITKLDIEIWRGVMATLRDWIDSGKKLVPIAINVSKTDILAMNVAEVLGDLLREYELPPMYLEVDIAENAYIAARSITVDTERRLRTMGLKVAIDNFSGDFVKLSGIEGIHADSLKVDMQKLRKDKRALEDIHEYVARKNINIVAVGVESMEMMADVRRNGCTAGQGFYLAKPVPIEKMEEFLNRE